MYNNINIHGRNLPVEQRKMIRIGLLGFGRMRKTDVGGTL